MSTSEEQAVPGSDPSPSHPFERYERLLWKILAKLTASGYVVPPSDANDLIHQFFIDHWMGLEARYDHARGPFKRYLVSAFYFFARRQIIHLRSWNNKLTDVKRLAKVPTPDGDREDPLDVADVRHLIELLENDERCVLQLLLSGQSERAIGKESGLSRYRVRELLVDAIGKIAAKFEKLTWVEPFDATVAVLLWREGRTVRDVAAILDVSLADIRASRERNVSGILKTLCQIPSQENHQMTYHNEALELLRRTLLTPDDHSLLGQVRSRASEIRQALVDADVELSNDDVRRLEESNKWVAQVYEAFGETGDEDEGDADLDRHIAKMRADKDREIGQAFATALETLPPYFHQWNECFPRVSEVPMDFQDYLRDQRIVACGGPHAQTLVRIGMTPGTFAEAARGVELLLNRLVRMANLPEATEVRQPPTLSSLYTHIRNQIASGDVPQLILTMSQSSTQVPGTVPIELLLSQMHRTPGCAPGVAESMAHWLVCAAQFKPFLFFGYEARTVNREGIQLTRSLSEREDDIVARWSRHSEEARVQLAAIGCF